MFQACQHIACIASVSSGRGANSFFGSARIGRGQKKKKKWWEGRRGEGNVCGQTPRFWKLPFAHERGLWLAFPFLLSPSPLFLFLLLPQFSRGQNIEICAETRRKRLLRRLASTQLLVRYSLCRHSATRSHFFKDREHVVEAYEGEKVRNETTKSPRLVNFQIPMGVKCKKVPRSVRGTWPGWMAGTGGGAFTSSRGASWNAAKSWMGGYCRAAIHLRRRQWKNPRTNWFAALAN